MAKNRGEESKEETVQADPSVSDLEKENQTAAYEVQDESVTEDSEEETPSELEELASEVDSLKKENSELKDQYLRKHADFENFRKRMAREKADSVKYGNQELLKDLIEVIDNFDRAIKSADDSQDFNAFRDGISMIEQQFTGMLQAKWGLEKMECKGIEYDPNSHEALMMEELEDLEVPTVMEDFQAGYKLHDRVLRPAKVKVGKPVAPAAEPKETIDE